MKKIHKYRIAEFEDGYGKLWFRTQCKGWFRWHYARKYRGPFDLAGEIIEFETIEEAQHNIGMSVNIEKQAMRNHSYESQRTFAVC